jgi:hypothetical protein
MSRKINVSELTNSYLKYKFRNSPVIRALVDPLAEKDLYSSKNKVGPHERLEVDVTALFGPSLNQHDSEVIKARIGHIFNDPTRRKRLRENGIEYIDKLSMVQTPGCIISLAIKSDTVKQYTERLTKEQPLSIEVPAMEQTTKHTETQLCEKAKFIRHLMERKVHVHKAMTGVRDLSAPRPMQYPYDQLPASNSIRLDDRVLSRVLSEFSKIPGFDHALLTENIILKEETYTTEGDDGEDTVVVRMNASMLVDGGVIYCIFDPHTLKLYNLEYIG